LFIDYEGRRISEIETELPGMADAESRQQAGSYLALKRQHLSTFKEMLPVLAKKATVGTSA
jgi:hypothetical protein